MKKKKMSTRDPVARLLRTPKFRSRAVSDKTKYNRNVTKRQLSKESGAFISSHI